MLTQSTRLPSTDSRQLFALSDEEQDAFGLEPGGNDTSGTPLLLTSPSSQLGGNSKDSQRVSKADELQFAGFKRPQKPTTRQKTPQAASGTHESTDELLLSSLIDSYEPAATELTPTSAVLGEPHKRVKARLHPAATLGAPYSKTELSDLTSGSELVDAEADEDDSDELSANWRLSSRKPASVAAGLGSTRPTSTRPTSTTRGVSARPASSKPEASDADSGSATFVDDLTIDNATFGVDDEQLTPGAVATSAKQQASASQTELQMLRLMNSTSNSNAKRQSQQQKQAVANSELLSHLIGVTPLTLLDPIAQSTQSTIRAPQATTKDAAKQHSRGIFSPQSTLASSFLFDLLRLLRPNSQHNAQDFEQAASHDKQRQQLGLLQQLRVLPAARLLSLSAASGGSPNPLVEPRSADESNSYYQRVSLPNSLSGEMQALLAALPTAESSFEPRNRMDLASDALPGFAAPRGSLQVLVPIDAGGDPSVEEESAKNADFVANVAGFVRQSDEDEMPQIKPREDLHKKESDISARQVQSQAQQQQQSRMQPQQMQQPPVAQLVAQQQSIQVRSLTPRAMPSPSVALGYKPPSGQQTSDGQWAASYHSPRVALGLNELKRARRSVADNPQAADDSKSRARSKQARRKSTSSYKDAMSDLSSDFDADSSLPLSVVQLDGKPTGGGRVHKQRSAKSAPRSGAGSERATASSDLMSQLLNTASSDELDKDDDDRDELDDDDADTAKPRGDELEHNSDAGNENSASEVFKRRKQSGQQRADVEFYGHPGEETRELKYGILGSGNYDIIRGGNYPKHDGTSGGGDESSAAAAAVNSVANYMRSGAGNVEQQSMLGDLPKLLGGYALALNGVDDAPRLTGGPPLARAHDGDFVLNGSPLLELIDASAVAGGKNYQQQVGGPFSVRLAGSSTQSQFASGDEADKSQPQARVKKPQANKGKAAAKRKPAARGKHKQPVLGFQGYDDFAQTHGLLEAGTRRHLATASNTALQQQQSQNMVTIFSETDLDSLPSQHNYKIAPK